jgi:hypothetical protein
MILLGTYVSVAAAFEPLEKGLLLLLVSLKH